MKTTFTKKAKCFLASALSAIMCLTFIPSGASAATDNDTVNSESAAFEVVAEEPDCTCSENEHIHSVGFCSIGETASVQATCLHQNRGSTRIGTCPTCNGFLYRYYCKDCGKTTGRWCLCGYVSFI